MTTKLCRNGCGQFIEWNEVLKCYVNAGTPVRHDCPAFHKKGRVEPVGQIQKRAEPEPPKVIHSFNELQHEIELAMEHIINAANAVSKTVEYDVITRPRGQPNN